METIIGVIIGALSGAFITLYTQRIERKDKFRMAAIEKRLEAHQKAYAQCDAIYQILDERDKDVIGDVISDMRKLLTNYSLYLEKGTRKKFVEVRGALMAFRQRCDDIDNITHPEKRDLAFKWYTIIIKKLEELSFLIQKEVELEPIAINNDKLKFEK